MKKLDSKGFGIVEGLLILVVVGIIGGAGFYVYKANKNTNDSLNATGNSEVVKQEKPKEEIKPSDSTPYSFKVLGISMDIKKGWVVKSDPTQEEGVNFYSWTVQKEGSDGKIELSSTGFRGGFEGCHGSESLTAATVKDVAPTQNANLMFMSWSYRYDNETHNITGIVPSSETVFRTTNNGNTAAIANKDVKAGNYFICLSEPLAGFSLKLNNESAPGFSRKDRITAFSSSSSDKKYLPLPSNAESYEDIKTMLTSIR